VVPVDCDWDDIGDWVALERLLERHGSHQSTNTVLGRHVGLETSGNIIYTEGVDDVVFTIGVHDLVIVKRSRRVAAKCGGSGRRRRPGEQVARRVEGERVRVVGAEVLDA
jgi:hypothetical protein